MASLRSVGSISAAAWVASLVLLCGPTSAADEAALRAAPYHALSALKVSVSGAVLDGKTLTVRVKTRRTVTLRLAVIWDTRTTAFTSLTAKPGDRTLTRTLNTTPAGIGLRLRVTAQIGKLRAQQILTLRIAPPAPSPQG
jgi:hypothetical protein